MLTKDIKACIMIAACACGEDGVISSEEETEMFRILEARYHGLTEALFEEALTEFFESDLQIEDYLHMVTDGELRRFALSLAELSASADGLDPRENVALERAYTFWGINRHA